VRETMAPAGINVLLVRQSPRDGDGMKRVDPRRYREAQHEALAALPRIGLPGRGSPHVAFMESIARGVAGTMHSGRRGFHCHAGVHGAMVDPEGEVNACEVLSEQKDTRSMGNLRDHDMDFGALWNSPRAARIRGCVNRHAACRACTHETMGYAPSLLFAPNRIRRSVPPRRTVGERLREATGRVRDACAPPAAMEVTT